MSAPQTTLATALVDATHPAEAQIAEWKPPAEWTDGWRNLVLDLVDPERHLTDLETAYFFARAQKLGLDPLARQIFPVKLSGRMEPFVGIHGIRMLAERTGERAGEQVTARTYDAQGVLTSVEVTIQRKNAGGISLYVFTARASEFGQKNSPPGSSWASKTEVMLTKCAAANAYRMGFPEVLGGLYIPEEVE